MESEPMDPSLVAELKAGNCWEPRTDRLKDDPTMTEFKQRARLHQARWRERRGLAMGGPVSKETGKRRQVGSWLDFDEAKAKGSNFLSPHISDAAWNRINNKEKHEAPLEERLLSNLLGYPCRCASTSLGSCGKDQTMPRKLSGHGFPTSLGKSKSSDSSGHQVV